MHDSQAPRADRTTAAEPQEPPGVIGEPGKADRTAPGGPPWRSDHPVNIRLSIPLLSRRYYLTLVAGTERRSAQRMAEERKKHPLAKTGNVLVFGMLGIFTGLACLAVIQLAAGYLLRHVDMVVGAQ